MLIGQVIPPVIVLPLVIVSFWTDSLISCHNKNKIVTICFSTELEYYALANATFELFWLHKLLQDMGITHSFTFVLHCENIGTIQIAHNNVFHECTKQIKIDYHFIT